MRSPPAAGSARRAWKHSFETTSRTGGERFGERYVLLRNEDLRANTAAALATLYAALARPVPDPVEAWAAEKVRSAEEPYAARDRRWLDAFRRLEMEDAVAEAGYPELLDEDSYETPVRARGLSRLWR
jgi:hypothetical protein